MQIVPTRPLANQNLQVQLAGQACTLQIMQNDYGLYIDVEVAGEPIIMGVVAENLNRIVRDTYLGFIGDFIFVDTQGETDPVYTGLGDRYQLIYLEEADLPAED